PYNDLNTREELLIYDKIPNLLKIEDGELKTPQEDLKSESKSLLSRATPPTERHPDDIFNAMISKDVYSNGSKIIRTKDIPEDSYFNKTTGLFVKKTNKDYQDSVAKNTALIYYT
ncbi:MAG: hypothetical protein ACK56F_15275, partial [bacterium]